MAFRRVLSLWLMLLLALILWQEALYVTSDAVVVGWTRGSPVESGPETYDVVAVWESSSGIRQEFPVGSTENLEFVITRPRVGFFHVKVRAHNATEISDWAVSTNPEHALVDGVPRGWRLFFELSAPPSGGIL